MARIGGLKVTPWQETGRRRPCRLGTSFAVSLTMVFYFLLAWHYFASAPVDSHALGVKLVTARKTHNPTDAVDILLQAHDTLDLSPHILLPLA